jgi:hypothetical protein
MRCRTHRDAGRQVPRTLRRRCRRWIGWQIDSRDHAIELHRNIFRHVNRRIIVNDQGPRQHQIDVAAGRHLTNDNGERLFNLSQRLMRQL